MGSDVQIVRTKLANYQLWTSGAFGNRLRAWRSVEAWRASGFAGSVTMRYLGLGGGPCEYDVPEAYVELVLDEWRFAGWDTSLVMINESAPDESVVLQGEYLNDPVPVLYFSTAKAKMRVALATEAKTISGYAARIAIESAMTPSSWADFEVLLETYPVHVLEVSVYCRNLGDISGRNALVWEVRAY